MVGVRMRCNNIIKLFNAAGFKIAHNRFSVFLFAGVNENACFSRLQKDARALTDINKMYAGHIACVYCGVVYRIKAFVEPAEYYRNYRNYKSKRRKKRFLLTFSSCFCHCILRNFACEKFDLSCNVRRKTV